MTSFMRELRNLARTYYLTFLVSWYLIELVFGLYSVSTCPTGNQRHIILSTAQSRFCLCIHNSEASTRTFVHFPHRLYIMVIQD